MKNEKTSWIRIFILAIAAVSLLDSSTIGNGLTITANAAEYESAGVGGSDGLL